MRLKQLVIFVFLLGIATVIWISIPKQTPNDNGKTKNATNVKDNPYFMTIPITKFTNAHIPCLEIKVAHKPISAKLDLGFRGVVELPNSFLQTVQEKTFLRSRIKYGFRGKSYLSKVYKITKLEIGKMSFCDPYVEESNEDMDLDATIVKNKKTLATSELGIVGWELFEDVNLFMDLKNSAIALCDSFDTLIKQGYSIEDFAQVPLLIEQGFIEFEATTANGSLRCMLDTGSTWNVLNIKNEENRPLEEVACDSKNIVEFPIFKIGETVFNNASFHLLPIRFPVKIEAILGMDFLAHHLVFIDFSNKQIYFAPSK